MDLFALVADGDADALRGALEADPTGAGARNDDGVSLVRWALYRGRRDLADIVVAAEPPLDIFDATSTGDLTRIRTLLADDPALARAHSADGFTALHFAAFLATEAEATALLEAGADPAARANGVMDVEPLHSAAAAYNLAVAQLLVEHGAPVNDTQAGGFTPLHEAALSNQRELVDLLLAAGADASMATDEGQTAADLAAEHGHTELAAALAQQSPLS